MQETKVAARDCYAWFTFPHLDPVTQQPLGGTQVDEWKRKCANVRVPPLRPVPTQSECRQWHSRPNYNPRTAGVLTPYSYASRQWEQSCPRPVPSYVTRSDPQAYQPLGELTTQTCPFLDEILQAICLTPLTQPQYDELLFYRDVFLRNFLKEQPACFGGKLELYIDDTYQTVRLRNNDVNWTSCLG